MVEPTQEGARKGEKVDGGPYLGPLTEAMLRAERDKPPAIVREWGETVKHPGELVLFWAGSSRSRSGGFSWTDLTVNTTDGEEGPVGTVHTTPPEHVERLLAPLAHAGRMRIMQSLYDSDLAAGELSEAVGLTGGGLYHHLRELRHAAYVTDRDGRYALTNLGRQLLITMTVIASRVIVDRGEQGLGVGTHTTSEPSEDRNS